MAANRNRGGHRERITNILKSHGESTGRVLSLLGSHSEQRFHDPERESPHLFHPFPSNRLLVFSDFVLPSLIYKTNRSHSEQRFYDPERESPPFSSFSSNRVLVFSDFVLPSVIYKTNWSIGPSGISTKGTNRHYIVFYKLF